MFLITQYSSFHTQHHSCRDWYHEGRTTALEENSSLHITAPYAFAVSSRYGQSATSPLVDARTGEHVAQVLYDFDSGSVFEALTPQNTPLVENGFPILVAVQGNPEENTVIGPGFSLGDEASEISRVVLEVDHNCTEPICNENVDSFRAIVESMKEWGTNATSFSRSKVR